jgi:Tol biopolymer transport system component
MFAKHNLIVTIVIALLTISFLSACGPSPTPEVMVVKETVVVTATPLPPTPTQPDVSASVEREIAVSAKQGLEYQEEGLPFIYIPPDALDHDTTLRIEQVDAAPQQPDTQLAGPAFDIKLADGSLRAPIEIALPLTLSDVDPTEAEVFAAYYEDDIGWIALPSWLSEDGQMVHATLDHLTLTGSFSSPLSRNPRINLKQATPNPFTNVGWPPCFKDDLTVRVDAYDPDGKVRKVEVMFHFHTFGSELVTIGTEFVQAINGLGLVIMAGDITAAMPAAQTIVTLATAKDPGIVASQWADMGEDPDHPGVYYASMDLSRLSTCEDYFDVDAAMTGTGIKKIVAEIKVTDNSSRIKKDRIEIPVFSYEPPYAVLFEPGPGVDDIQGPQPTFRWQYENVYHSYVGRLVYARGDSLWERWWGKKVIPLEWHIEEWQPDKDLKPGEYVWGVEVSSDEWFRPENTIRSSVYHFTVASEESPAEVELDIVIAPSRGEQGELFRVSVSGLEPNGSATVWLIRPGSTTGEVLYDDVPANNAGRGRFSISSHSDMGPGIYTVYVEANESGIGGEATFELLARKVVPKATLHVEGTTVVRSEIEDDPGNVPLWWSVYRGGELYDSVGAHDVVRLNLEDYPPGEYTVVLEIDESAPAEDEHRLVPISNQVTVVVEEPIPTEGGKIAFVKGGDLWIMNPDGSDQQQVTSGVRVSFRPSWSPDGTRIAFSALPDIYIVDVDGSNLVKLTQRSRDCAAGDPSWSPDGRKIVFVDYCPMGKIAVMNIDGSSQATLADGGFPVWSPDGNRIAFAAPQGLSIISADGSGITRIVDDNVYYSSWSPDGMKLAYSGFKGIISTIGADGSGLVELVEGIAPTWSLDGSKIAFGMDKVYVMNADGTGLHAITEGGYPSWSPK